MAKVMEIEAQSRLKVRLQDYLISADKYDFSIYTEILGLEAGLRKAIWVTDADRKMLKQLVPLLKHHRLRIKPILTGECRGFCLSRECSIEKDFEEAIVNGDVLHTGQLLGYPECCIKFHINARKDVNCLTSHKNSGEFNWLLNNIGSEHKLISHYPCSYTCKESVKKAEKILRLICRLNGREMAADFACVLKQKVALYHGISFSFKALGEPFPATRTLMARFKLAEGTELMISRRTISALSPGGDTRILAKKFTLFDFSY